MLKCSLGWVMGENEPMENSEKKKICISSIRWYSISIDTIFFHNGQCWYSVSIDTQKTGDPTLGGLVIGNFSIWLILKKWQPFFNFFIMADADIPFLLTHGKLETQTLGGVSNWKSFRTIDIKEMAAIFQFFHNGWHLYSVSVNTWKTGDPNFGRSVIGNFSIRLILKKWQPFFNFFIMTNADIPFPLTLGKLETQTLGGLVIGKFSVRSILTKWQPFFNFFIMADADIPFPSTLGKLETQTLGGSVIGNFSIWSILKKWQPFFNFSIMADTYIPLLSTLGKLEIQTLGGQ